MTVNSLSPLAAGIRLLAFGAMVPVGAGTSALAMDRWKIPPTYMCVAGAILQIVGLVFLSRASISIPIQSSQFGFQIITGYGNGLIQTAVILLIPYVLENRDLGWCISASALSLRTENTNGLPGVGNATIAQFRILGGVIGIAITTEASSPLVKKRLLQFLPINEVLILLDRTSAIGGIPAATQTLIRHSFEAGFNLQTRILIGTAAGHIAATALLWTKTPMRISRAGPARIRD